MQREMYLLLFGELILRLVCPLLLSRLQLWITCGAVCRAELCCAELHFVLGRAACCFSVYLIGRCCAVF